MATYSIIVLKAGAKPPDVSRSDIINVSAPWDLVEGLAKLALARYPGADPVENPRLRANVERDRLIAF